MQINYNVEDFFRKQLEAAGFNYYGTETMYSGTDGIPLQVILRVDFLESRTLE